MNKQTTLEEFEKGMTENLSYLQRNTKEGKYVWTKSHVCNPERSFSRSWKMTLCMWGEEGYVKEATFSLTYDLSLQYAGDNGSAAGIPTETARIPTETARIPMYRDGVPITTFKAVDKSAKILLDKVEQVLGLAEKFERGFWELNQTSKGLTSLERAMF